MNKLILFIHSFNKINDESTEWTNDKMDKKNGKTKIYFEKIIK